MTADQALELLLSLSKDPQRREEFMRNPPDVLKAMTFALSEEEIVKAREILTRFPSRRLETLSENLHVDFGKMALEVRSSVLRVVKQIEDGFTSVMKMYKVAFYSGIILIGLSVLLGLIVRQDIIALAFGGLGTSDILVYFIYKPAVDLQTSRGNLAQLEMAFVSWIGDVHNWNQVLGYVAEEAKSTQEIVDTATRASSTLISNLKETMKAIDDFAKQRKNSD